MLRRRGLAQQSGCHALRHHKDWIIRKEEEMCDGQTSSYTTVLVEHWRKCALKGPLSLGL